MSIGALVGITAALASCGGPEKASEAEGQEAERVAVRWLKAMADSDIKAACRLMDANNRPRRPEHPNWSPAKSCQEGWLHSDNTPLNWEPKPNVISIWGESQPKVLDVVVDGDGATVVVDGLGGEGRPVWLKKERGRWLVDGVEYPI
jgi:hypothetical protein